MITMASEKRKPSDQLKARLGAELLSEVESMGRMAHRLCESSQSRQVGLAEHFELLSMLYQCNGGRPPVG